MQEKVPLNVSWSCIHSAVSLLILRVTIMFMINVLMSLSAGSTESPTWRTTGWWITQILTGKQRSADRNVQSVMFWVTLSFSATQIKYFYHCSHICSISGFNFRRSQKVLARSLSAKLDFWFRIIDFAVCVSLWVCISPSVVCTHYSAYTAGRHNNRTI